jgi:hypothetical protein
MTDEPIYVEAGDEFDHEDNSWKYPHSLQNYDIIMKVFSVCGNRKYFRSKKEFNKWKRIDGQLSRGAMREEWVENCIKWAEEKNATLCAIKVDALGSLVLNKVCMQDWLLEHKDELRRPEDYF